MHANAFIVVICIWATQKAVPFKFSLHTIETTILFYDLCVAYVWMEMAQKFEAISTNYCHSISFGRRYWQRLTCSIVHKKAYDVVRRNNNFWPKRTRIKSAFALWFRAKKASRLYRLVPNNFSSFKEWGSEYNQNNREMIVDYELWNINAANHLKIANVERCFFPIRNRNRST